MRTGPISRFPASEQRYSSYRVANKHEQCDFCYLAKNGGKQVLDTTENFIIIDNIFGYDIWDGCGVMEHIMISCNALML